MRRFIDSITYLILAVLAVVVFFALSAAAEVAELIGGGSLQWSGAAVSFFMFPVLALMTFIALARGITNIKPVRFYLALFLVFLASCGVIFLYNLIPADGGANIGAAILVMFTGACAISSLLGLVLGATKAIECLSIEERAQIKRDKKDLAAYRASQDQAATPAPTPASVTENSPAVAPDPVDNPASPAVPQRRLD